MNMQEDFKRMYKIHYQTTINGEVQNNYADTLYTTLSVEKAHEYLQKRLTLGEVHILDYQILQVLIV